MKMTYQLLALQLHPSRRDYSLILKSSENSFSGDSSCKFFEAFFFYLFVFSVHSLR